MDISAISQVTGAMSGSAGVSVDSGQILSEIAANSALTDGERTAMVQTVALADTLNDSAAREVVLSQVQGLGIFLKNAGDKGLPRWSVMTALRAYGLNIEDKPSVRGSAVVAQARAHLSKVASNHGVSVEHAVAAAKVAVTAPVTPAPVQHTVKIEKVA